MARSGRKPVILKKDGRREVAVPALSENEPTKFYILGSGGSNYYQVSVDETGDPALAIEDVGTTRPTDGIVIEN